MITIAILGECLGFARQRFRLLALLAVAAAGLLSGSIPAFGQQTNATVQFSSPSYFTAEDAGPAIIHVVRTGVTNTAVTVTYATGTGLATAGTDYTPQSGVLSFAPGETDKTFSVPLLDDPFAEGSEIIPLTLANPGGGAVLGARATARLSIQDDENRGTLLDSTFNGAIQPNDYVRAIAVQTNGKIVVGGDFARAGSASPDRVLRFNADGSRDTTFATPNGWLDGTVYVAVLQSDGRILIGGEFTVIGSTPRSRIARLNADGSLDLSFDPGSGVGGNGSPWVYSITVQGDGKLLIAGSFESVNGLVRNGVARLNTNGSLDTTFDPGAGISSTDQNFRVPWVSAAVLQTDGKVLISGQFTDVDGVSRHNIARLNTNGTVDTSFDPGLGATGDRATVEAIAVQPDGKIIIGGGFAKVNDIDRNGLARVNPDGTVDLSFDLGGGVMDVDANGGGIVGFVTSVVLPGDGKVLFAGTFLTVDQIHRHGVARVSRDGAVDGTFGPYSGTTYRNQFGYEEMESISALALQPDGKILIGGTFVSADGNRTNRLTRLLSTNVRTSSFEFLDPGVFVGENSRELSVTVIRRGDSIDAFTVDYATVDGTAMAGKDYTPQSGTLPFGPSEAKKTITIPIPNDGVLEEDETFNIGLRNPSTGGELGSPTNFVVRIIDAKKPGNLDFSFGRVVIPFLPDPTSALPVTAILVQDDLKVLVSGTFVSVNGTSRPGIVRLNPDGTIDPGFAPQAPRGAPLLATIQMGLQPDGRVVGGFDGAFRLNADGSLDPSFSPELEAVNSLTVQKDGQIIVSDEYFDPRVGVYVNGITRFLANGVFDGTFSPTDLDDWVNVIVAQPDGKVVIGGYFTQVNGVTQNRIARLNVDGSLDTGFKIGSGLPGTNSAVYGLALQPDGKVIVGGYFDSVNGVTRNHLARLNADGTVDSGFRTGSGPNNFVNALAVQTDGKVLVGGGFISVNGVRRAGLARLNSDGSVDPSFNPKLQFSGQVLVNVIVVQPDGRILIGGLFTAVNGVARSGLARLNGDASYVRLDAAPGGQTSPFRLTLTSQPGKEYRIEASADLLNWVPIGTNIATGSSLQIDDPNAASPAARFYRAVITGP